MNRLPIPIRLATLVMLVACLGGAVPGARAGIPPRSLPRLIRLQDELAAVDPRQIAVVVECDARLPVPAATPVLQLSIHAAIPGRFAPIDVLLPLVRVPAPAAPAELPPLAADRQRLHFMLAADSLARLAAAQSRLRELQGQRDGRNGVHVSLSLGQQAMLAAAQGFAATRWDTWLQSARQEGWYPVWSGTVRELAEESRADGG